MVGAGIRNLYHCATPRSENFLPQLGFLMSVGGLYQLKNNGGETGIRTLGTREGSTVFETAPFDHSGTSPHRCGASV